MNWKPLWTLVYAQRFFIPYLYNTKNNYSQFLTEITCTESCLSVAQTLKFYRRRHTHHGTKVTWVMTTFTDSINRCSSVYRLQYVDQVSAT